MRSIGRTFGRSAALATILALVMSATALAVTWGPAVAISASGHVYALLQRPVGVTGTQKVHVFYTEDDGITSQAWYRQSTDGGSTFATPVLLSHVSAYGAAASAINRDGTTVDVVYWEWDSSGNYRVWYRNSTNAGTDWSTPKALTPALGDAGKSDVVRVGDRVTVSYTDGANGKVYVRISTNGGGTFGAKKAVGTTTNQPFLPGANSYDAFAAVGDSSGTITVAWNSSATTIKTRRSTDGGASWSTPLTLATNSYGQSLTLTTAAAKIIIGYKSVTASGSRSTQRHSADEGAHWTDAAYVAGVATSVPTFAYNGGVLRTAYTRCTASNCSTQASFFRTSTNFGGTWSAEAQASRSIHTPYAFAAGVAAIANGQSLVIYLHVDGSGNSYLYARKTL